MSVAGLRCAYFLQNGTFRDSSGLQGTQPTNHTFVTYDLNWS